MKLVAVLIGLLSLLACLATMLTFLGFWPTLFLLLFAGWGLRRG